MTQGVRRLARRDVLVGGAVALGALAVPGVAGAVVKPPRDGSPRGRTVAITAHPDDPLLFLSPDLLKDVGQLKPVVVAFLTAGDAGRGTAYWESREAGVLAAVAEMTGLQNSWSSTPMVLGSHTVAAQTLIAKPSVSVAFFRLPDGSPYGTGYAGTGNQSLEKLWNGSLSSIDAVDGSTSYTKADLEATLAMLITRVNPFFVRTQDYVDSYGDGDHSDHYSAAYFTRAGASQATIPVTVLSYIGYPGMNQPPDIGKRILTEKMAAFFAYAPYDPGIPENEQQLKDMWNGDYYAWVCRQIVVATDSY